MLRALLPLLLDAKAMSVLVKAGKSQSEQILPASALIADPDADVLDRQRSRKETSPPALTAPLGRLASKPHGM
jgi:hypothetical protein